jgi:uncharacterized protein
VFHIEALFVAAFALRHNITWQLDKGCYCKPMSTFSNNPSQKRFELAVDDATAALYYTIFEDKLYLEHTEVPEVLRGKGIAGKLVEGALEYARANNLPIVPMCPYANKYIQRNPQYQTLLDASERKR